MEMQQYENDSPFNLPTELDNVWRGIEKFDMQQVLPDSGMPSAILVGTGNASGTTTFQWNENASWWSPVNSYFYFKFRFVKYTGSPATPGPIPILDSSGNLQPTDLVCYADNFVSTLFSTIVTRINQEAIDNITQPWIVDQVLTYSNAKKNFLDTFGSMARVGESLQTRLYNTYGDGNSSGGVVEVCYRPPCSIYNVNLMPPGAQHTIEFTWNQNIVNAFESLIGSIDSNIGTSAGNYNIFIDSFYLYKATCNPSKMIPLPSHGVIELAPCKVKQYPITGTNNYQQNITLAPTTNRIYLAFQDSNQTPKVTTQTTASTSPFINTTGIKYMGYGTGWTPATSFTKSFSYSPDASTPPTLVELQQLFIQISDLALILPHPPYNFSTNKTDYNRAYMDWANQSVGTKYNDTGSVPFGLAISAANTSAGTYAGLKIPGITIVAPEVRVNNVVTATYQAGNPSNDQQLNYITAETTNTFPLNTVTNALYFQTYEYGWLARHPGPIFAFNICRPGGVKISQGDVNVTFTGNGPKSALLSVLCCYNTALAVVKDQFGRYNYQLVSGQ